MRPTSPLHPSNVLLVGERTKLPLDQGVPPAEQHSLTDEPEPGCIFQSLVNPGLGLDVLEHLAQLVRTDPAGSLDLILVDLQVDIGLNEQDIVDLVLAPLPVRRG